MDAEEIVAAEGLLEARPSLEPGGSPGQDVGGIDEIQQLRERKFLLNQQRKILTKQLRNEQRKRQRLRERAKKLSNADILRVLAEREAVARAKAKPKARSGQSSARA